MTTGAHPSRHERGSPEFARVTNLSDAVFAIAMTLLVLTLDTPRVASGRLGASLADQLPQVVVFVLAFALVANLWWQHHKLLGLFVALEPGLVGLNLALLGAVALVPFPTSLVASTPSERAAVLAFVATFALLSVLFLLLVVRAWTSRAFDPSIREADVYLLVGQWISGLVVLVVAGVAAWWLPHVGLAVLALTIVFGPVAARRGDQALRRRLPPHEPG
jgi:uncharacterized membrane protein